MGVKDCPLSLKNLKLMECKKVLKCPIIVAPAMNTAMFNVISTFNTYYQHPITKKQLNIIQDWGYVVLQTVEKRLACGDFGFGAMASH